MRFFHRVAQFCSRESSQGGSTSQSDSFASALYHRLRLSFLHACFEATAERLLRVGPLEASSSGGRAVTPVSPALSAPAPPVSSPPTSQSSQPLVVVSPPRSSQAGSGVVFANACFVPFTGPVVTGGTRVPLMSMPTVLGFLAAQPGSQSSPVLSSRQASVTLVSSSGAAVPAAGSDSRTLLGSPPPSPSASASQPTARVSQVLFEGSTTASAASESSSA